jgi:hypothetical protein
MMHGQQNIKFTVPCTIITASFTDSSCFLQNYQQDILQNYLTSPLYPDVCLPADLIHWLTDFRISDHTNISVHNLSLYWLTFFTKQVNLITHLLSWNSSGACSASGTVLFSRSAIHTLSHNLLHLFLQLWFVNYARFRQAEVSAHTIWNKKNSMYSLNKFQWQNHCLLGAHTKKNDFGRNLRSTSVAL